MEYRYKLIDILAKWNNYSTLIKVIGPTDYLLTTLAPFQNSPRLRTRNELAILSA